MCVCVTIHVCVHYTCMCTLYMYVYTIHVCVHYTCMCTLYMCILYMYVYTIHMYTIHVCVHYTHVYYTCMYAYIHVYLCVYTYSISRMVNFLNIRYGLVVRQTMDTITSRLLEKADHFAVDKHVVCVWWLQGLPLASAGCKTGGRKHLAF